MSVDAWLPGGGRRGWETSVMLDMGFCHAGRRVFPEDLPIGLVRVFRWSL